MKDEAQKFMNRHRLKECFEVDGVLFKHRSNADIRKQASGKEIIVYTINAGVKPKSIAEKPEEEIKSL